MPPLSKEQLQTLATVERIASVASALGVATIIGAFCLSPQFRNPIHRVVFINAFFNIFDVTATMISLSGPEAGNTSALCQFQGFLMQMFPMADVFWTLVMAIDVFLIVYYKYEAEDLHKLEAKYIGAITFFTLVPAVAFLFVNTPTKGPMYGSVTLWCAIAPKWVLFRIVLYYVPIWFSIAVIIILYALVGVEILKQRHALKATADAYIDLDSTVPGNNVSIDESSIGVALSGDTNTQFQPVHFDKGSEGKDSAFASLSETTSTSQIRDTPATSQMSHSRPHAQPSVSFGAYIAMPVLFFFILLTVWVTPTVNRLRTFVDPTFVSYPLLLSVGACGSLRGFWNGVVFIVVGSKERKRQRRLKRTYG